MKFVVTAGPTREPLDPVRYLSNRSSGKMGYAIAAAALEMKHEVILDLGTGRAFRAVRRGGGARHDGRGNVRGGRSALRALRCLRDVRRGLRLQAGALHVAENKKTARPFSLALEPTRDILASLTNSPHDCLVVGFAAETEELRRARNAS